MATENKVFLFPTIYKIQVYNYNIKSLKVRTNFTRPNLNSHLVALGVNAHAEANINFITPRPVVKAFARGQLIIFRVNTNRIA